MRTNSCRNGHKVKSEVKTNPEVLLNPVCIALVLTLLPSLLQGVARFYQTKKRHIITTQTEHKCVLDSCRVLEAEGFSITYLPVQKNGLLDLEVHMQNTQRAHTTRRTN